MSRMGNRGVHVQNRQAGAECRIKEQCVSMSKRVMMASLGLLRVTQKIKLHAGRKKMFKP